MNQPLVIAEPDLQVPEASRLPKSVRPLAQQYAEIIQQRRSIENELHELNHVGAKPEAHDLADAAEAQRSGEAEPPRRVDRIRQLEHDRQVTVTAAGLLRRELLDALRGVSGELIDAAVSDRDNAVHAFYAAVDALAAAHTSLARQHAFTRWATSIPTTNVRGYNEAQTPLALVGVQGCSGAIGTLQLFNELRHSVDWMGSGLDIDERTGAGR